MAFPRNGRAVSIKYEHTPMHQTVAELRQKFKPAPRPVPTKTSAATKTPKTPKAAKASQDPNTPGTKKTGTSNEKKPRSSTAGEGSARSRKRQKGNDGKAQPSAEAASSSVDTGSKAAPAAVQVPASGAVPVVSPAEAARRRKVANKLLSDAGVSPETLSQEQFNIFANQSPELQKDSLEMLVKYGAERLQIIHPAANPASAEAGRSASNMNSTQTSATGDLTTKELVPNRNSLPKSRKSGDRDSVGGDAAKTGKSRLACYQCKERRVKVSGGR